MSQPVDHATILDALRPIIDPDLGKDIVSLGFVKNIVVNGTAVSLTLELTTPACPIKEQFREDATTRLTALDGIESVEVEISSSVPQAGAMPGAAPGMPAPLPGVANTIAVASGKGGVGKSTVAVNLAAALAATGARVGLMDADVYGPSIPIMLGLQTARPDIRDGKIAPIEKYGIKLMSLGFLAGEQTPVIWRGPMVTKLIQQFLGDVDWGELDYLVIDLPPGTGDAQLTLAQAIRLSGSVIVTTPQEVALEDVRRGVRMFEKVDVPLLGIVENMSFFKCDSCGHRHEIFAHGGGRAAAESFDVPFLAEIPLDIAVRKGGDEGVPLVVSGGDSPQAAAFHDLAGKVASRLSIEALAGEHVNQG